MTQPQKERIPLTEEDIIDLHERVDRLSDVLEELFGILYHNTHLPEELKAEIKKLYWEKF